MEESQLLNLWRSYDKRLEENLQLNKKNAAEITKLKIRSLLTSMVPLKIFTILVGILWVGFVDVLIIGSFHAGSAFFLISAIIHVLLTKLAIGIYLYQLILIHQADISTPILATQERIARLKSLTLWVTRLLFLQLPVWTTFYWNENMFKNENIALHILQVGITVLFTVTAVWLSRNIKYENRDKKWFRLIFNGKEWDPLMKSMELLDQVNEYRADDKTAG